MSRLNIHKMIKKIHKKKNIQILINNSHILWLVLALKLTVKMQSKQNVIYLFLNYTRGEEPAARIAFECGPRHDFVTCTYDTPVYQKKLIFLKNFFTFNQGCAD